jgi:pimeloyl-ACP methyl ester carboxylesterase
VNTVVSVPATPELFMPALPEEKWTGWLFTVVGTAVDAAVLRAVRLAAESALVPDPGDMPRLREAAAPYVADDLQREPRRFFAFLDEPPPHPTVSGRLRKEIHGGVVISRRFVSDYERYHPPSQANDLESIENKIIPVEHWMHEPEKPHATVLCVHGFTMGQPRFDAFAMFASRWFAHGLDVALLTLPYHGARSPRHARFSGQYFATQEIGELSEAVRQSVHDIRLVLTWLKQHTQRPVGLLGLSLGGYLSALVAGLIEDVDFVVAMAGPVCIGDLAWRLVAESRRYRAGSELPLSRDELRAAYRVHSPLTYRLRIPRERALIIAPRGDRIVPPEHPHTLWHHWNEPPIYWFSGSHLAPFRRERIAEAILAHFTRLGIL